MVTQPTAPLRRRRRILRWVLLAVGLLILAPMATLIVIAALDISVSAGPWRDRIGAAASQALGRKVTLEGPLEMVPSLRPVLRVGGIRIANAPGFTYPDFAYLGQARLRVDLLAALTRRELRIGELTAENVRVQLEQSADGRVNWEFRTGAKPAPQSEGPKRQLDLSAARDVGIDVRNMALRNVDVEYLVGETRTRHYFQLQELTAEAPRDQPVRVALHGTVEKKFPYSLTFSGGLAQDLLKPDVQWPVKLSFDFVNTALQAEGMVSRNAQGEKVDLLIGMGTGDLTQIERFLQTALPEVGAVAMSMHFRWDGRTLGFADIRGVMGRTTLEGDLRYDLSHRKAKISGDLRLPTLDLRPFLGMKPESDEPPKSLLDTYRELQKQTISLRGLNSIDVDLKLGVGQWLSLPGDVRDATLGLQLAEGKLHAPVAATIAGVPLRGEVNADGAGELPGFELALGAQRTPIGGLATLLTGVRGIDGDLGTFLFRLRGQGEKLAQVLETLDVRLTVADSRLSYGNIEGGRPVDFRLDDFDVRLPGGKPLTGRIKGSLLGERFDAALAAADLPTLANTLRSPITLTANASGARLKAVGSLAPPDAKDGSELAFELSAPRAGAVGRWIGVSEKAAAALLLKGKARLRADEWRLSDFALRLGRSAMTGDFARVGIGRQPLIQAKLEVPALDVAELESMLPTTAAAPKAPAPASATGTNTLDIPILPKGIDLTDADIEVRVKRVTMQLADVTDASFVGRIRAGKMDASPFGATIAGTPFTGAVAIDLRGNLPEASLWVAGSHVDVGALLRNLKVTQEVDARVESLRVQLIGRGSRLGEMLARSALDVNLETGDLILRDPARKPLADIDVTSGRVVADPGKPVTLTIDGAIDATPVAIKVSTGALPDFLRTGSKVPFALDVDTAGTRLSLSGKVPVPITGKEGELQLHLGGARFDSLNKLARVQLPPWGPWSLGGRFIASAKGYEVPDLTMIVGESRLNGRGAWTAGAQRPRLDIALSAPRVQLDDFAFGTWSPFENKAAQDEKKMSVEEMRAKAKEAAAEGQRLLSPETLRRLDAYLDVQVEQVLSGKDRLGNGQLHAQMADGRLDFGPAKVNVPGGSALIEAAYVPTERDVAVQLRVDVERFDYGILGRRLKPDTDLQGLFSVKLELDSRAPTLDRIMSNADGHVDFAVWPKNMRSGIFDMWAVNLFLAMVPAVDPAASSKVNCAVGRFDLRKGVLTHDALLIDTSRMRVVGTGKVDFDSERLDFRLAPRAKTAQFFSLATPIGVSGTLTDYKIGVAPGGIAETALRLLTSAFVVPIEKLTKGSLPRDGADICSNAVRAAANRR